MQRFLSNFVTIRPAFETDQQSSLDWFLAAHIEAEKQIGAEETFAEKMKERMERVACGSDRIAKRGHVLDDFLHRDWSRMGIYRLNEIPSGKLLGERMKAYSQFADRILESFYVNESAPDNLIHVSCTGYVSPSAAQKLVSKKQWGSTTTVTHAYHMGCYGAFPALRMARGFEGKRADIVHTEICSLHSNPSLHEIDQIVSQSLFADGFIKYSLSDEKEGIAIHTILEELIPDSLDAMSWDVSDWGFQMGLSKEVPVLITRALDPYLARLAQHSPWSADELKKSALFAIHPGGPKILDYVRKLLHLTESQVRYSNQILREFGNMSSATLPHIWKEILEDSAVARGTPIVSMAFGPGLTICGAIMEKKCGG